MKLIRALLALYLLLSPMQGLAQVGRCRPDNTCAPGQICLGPADTRYCYITCTSTDALGSSRECPERESCLQPVGFTQEVCVAGESISGGTPSFSGISTAIACNEARPCPTGQTCTDGTCRQRFGGPCTNDDNCPPGVRCVGDRTRTCGIAPSAGTTSGAPSTAEPTEPPFVPIIPTLGVSIPGLDFSVPSREGGIVRVNFIAEYINAAYRYLSAIGLVAAIVMVVYGGFIYLVGSAGMSSVQRGKKIIIDAIAGMLLILSAYSILNIVNPATVNLTSLEFININEDQLQLTTRVFTGDPDEAEGTGTSGSASTGTSGSASTGGSCPVNLTEGVSVSPYRARDARVLQFMERMRTQLTGTDRRASITETARAAAACGIHMGSCGKTAGTIYEINDISGNGSQKHSIGTENVRFLIEINQNCARNSPGDRECKRIARNTAYERFRTSIPNWPNSWTTELQPGDWIYIFTAHSDGAGQHSAIFMGWEGNGRAKVVNGSWGRNVYVSTYCLTSACNNPYPLTKVWAPE